MALREGPLGEIKPPASWLAAAALILAVAGAVALLVLGGGRNGRLTGLQSEADSLTAPAAGVLAAPVRVTGQGLGVIQGYLLAGAQNRELRADLAAALSWRDEALRLRSDNARLKALLGLRTDPPLPMVAADTVLDARGPFSNSRLADVGANAGVAEGNPVLSAYGLVGRIAGLGADQSRIMLLTDVQSRTPVMIPRTNGRAILAGDGGPNPQLTYLRTHDPLVAGDRVLTSGDGGVIPRGLPVGTVVRDSYGAWRVALDADAQPIDAVRILLFSKFSQVAAPAALDTGALPSTATDAPEAAPTPANAAPPVPARPPASAKATAP